MAALFACTKCNSRHPFEELSSGQQLCKSCRGGSSLYKCTYCRTESQESFKGGSTSVCRRCDASVKQYGKPSACEYCNIIAAFVGSKCQRCTGSEKKYGLPLPCDQCKQRCAFDRKDDSRKKVEGKLLCWLCTLSYKRALAKAKQNTATIRHSTSSSLTNKSSHHHSQGHKRSHSSHSVKPKIKTEPSPTKKPKIEVAKSTNGSILPTTSDSSTLLDPNMSDHVVALTQLKDEIDSLQKKLVLKDQQMLSKDKQVSELKAQHGVLERELRLKIQSMQKSHTDIVDDLQSKVRVLTKQVVTLTKLTKKGVSTDSPQRL